MAIIGIVAVDLNWGIGYKNDLLFHIKEDMDFFKSKTIGNIVCMGHNTYKSLPNKPLKDRLNIVLCSAATDYDECKCVHSFEELLGEINDLSKDTSKDIYVIGGSSLYTQFLPYYDKIYVTKVFAEKPADAFFPRLDMETFTITEKSDIINTNLYQIQFIVYERGKTCGKLSYT